jgi:hypothetical protein
VEVITIKIVYGFKEGIPIKPLRIAGDLHVASGKQHDLLASGHQVCGQLGVIIEGDGCIRNVGE